MSTYNDFPDTSLAGSSLSRPARREFLAALVPRFTLFFTLRALPNAPRQGTARRECPHLIAKRGNARVRLGAPCERTSKLAASRRAEACKIR